MLFVDSADKAARFIWTCNAFNIPLLFLADVPGFMIGTAVEKQGIIRHGAKMISAVSEATVPKLSVIVRKAYGAGLYAMAGPAFEPDACIALPTASIAVMGPQAAVNAVFYNQLQAIEDPDERAAKTEELRREYAEDIDILHLASELVVDAVVQPEDLRAELRAPLRARRGQGPRLAGEAQSRSRRSDARAPGPAQPRTRSSRSAVSAKRRDPAPDAAQRPVHRQGLPDGLAQRHRARRRRQRLHHARWTPSWSTPHGRRVRINKVMLHHVVFIDNATRATTPARGRKGTPFFGTGEENERLVLPPGYGYRTHRGDNWRMVAMFMSHQLQAKTVYLQLPRHGRHRTAADRRAADVAARRRLQGRARLRRQRRRRPAQHNLQTTAWRMPVDGRIVAAGGHLHGGAYDLRVTQPRCGDRTLVNNAPRYGEPVGPRLPRVPGAARARPGLHGLAAFEDRHPGAQGRAAERHRRLRPVRAARPRHGDHAPVRRARQRRARGLRAAAVGHPHGLDARARPQPAAARDDPDLAPERRAATSSRSTGRPATKSSPTRPTRRWPPRSAASGRRTSRSRTGASVTWRFDDALGAQRQPRERPARDLLAQLPPGRDVHAPVHRPGHVQAVLLPAPADDEPGRHRQAVDDGPNGPGRRLLVLRRRRRRPGGGGAAARTRRRPAAGLRAPGRAAAVGQRRGRCGLGRSASAWSSLNGG